MEFIATAVGHVKKPDENTIYIEILPEFWDATLQLDKFSHINVLWWITGRDTPQDRANLKATFKGFSKKLVNDISNY